MRGARITGALAVFMALLVAMTAPGAAATGPALNFDSDKTPNPTIVEDELVVDEHDMGDMSSPLEYYDDSGEVSELPADYNDSEETPLGVRFDRVDADAYTLFPRIDGESDNSANWTVASDWTTATSDSTNVTESVSEADTEGIDLVEFTTSGMGAGDTATATFSENVSITSDANKRVLMWAGSVDSLSGTVEVRAVDSDGDYHYAEINSSADASDDDIIANGTGTSLVFQERLSELPLAGSGDGTLDEIQKVEIVAVDGDATVTTAGLDLESKSTETIADIERDTDGDGDLETTTAEEIYEGGKTNVTGLDSLGPWYDTATISDLSVYEVRYAFAELSDSEEYSVETSDADAYQYPKKLEIYGDMEVPSAIDLSHGALTLEFEQGLVTERYKTLEVASDVDSSEDWGNFTGTSDMVDKTGSLSGDGDTAELVASPSADTNYRVHGVVVLQNDEVDEVLDTSGAQGPTGSEGGIFSSLWGQIVGLVAAAAGAVGLGRVLDGGS